MLCDELIYLVKKITTFLTKQS